MKEIITKPSDPNASKEVIRVMEYLAEISGKRIITGQHTQTKEQPEISKIFEITGKIPALCGFELLSYSPNINYEQSEDECLIEVRENEGTLETAMQWAKEKRGLITFTWHWFSPVGGCGKSFYTKNTDFNPEKALEEGSTENQALISDMDYMAGLLKPFKDNHIPILWRPFHESEGKWFWWGSQSYKTAANLYRLMFERFSNHHGLNNLIWVWNSPISEGYPGDDVVDVISRDDYLPKRTQTDYKEQYDELIKITPAKKIAALGEVGNIPNIEILKTSKVPFSWYMTWSKEFCLSEEWNSFEQLAKTYNSEYAITLDILPKLY